MEEYNSKMDCIGDDPYFDLHTNDEPTSKASGEHSTDHIIEKHYHGTEYSNEKAQEKSFFMHLALQAIHEPFAESILADSETEYHTYCKTYGDSFLNNENHKNVCGEMIHVDKHFDPQTELEMEIMAFGNSVERI